MRTLQWQGLKNLTRSQSRCLGDAWSGVWLQCGRAGAVRVAPAGAASAAGVLQPICLWPGGPCGHACGWAERRAGLLLAVRPHHRPKAVLAAAASRRLHMQAHLLNHCTLHNGCGAGCTGYKGARAHRLQPIASLLLCTC